MRWRDSVRHWDVISKRLARQMRAQATPAERTLWERLRNRRLDGRRFRRQHAIDRFIVDFYCAERRLVVELDGDVHVGRVEHDEARDHHLRALGLRVLRLTNEQVLSDLDAAVSLISLALLPLSASGEGAGG
jgi:very-short-patch-repair endonuclease